MKNTNSVSDNQIDEGDLPIKKHRTVVQEYIDQPLLIRGLKFDLRVYVLVTSIQPLRIYLYKVTQSIIHLVLNKRLKCQDGLVRFATKEYSNKPEDIDDKYRHITNFSVNKGNKDFVYNEKPGGDITVD